MASNKEKELGLEEMDLKADPSRDVPTSGWNATVEALVERRERNEISALRAALDPAPEEPRRVMVEVRGRARAIRSKWGARFTKPLEMEVLGELDAIGDITEGLVARRQGGSLTEKQEAAEMRKLAPLLFAVRMRFEALQRMQDVPFRLQPKHADPAKRQRELDQINEFLAAKKRTEAA